MASIPEDKNKWLFDTLASILSAPHITIPKPIGGLRFGPGPVDVFSTRFINTFTEDVKAIVDGQELDRDGLKTKLLALQKYWNPTNVQFVPAQSLGGDDLASICCIWTPNDSDQSQQIEASANIIESGGTRINEIFLQGDVSLFN